MKTIIHIGQHKTGTTSIQSFLQLKKSEFRKEGLYIPDAILNINNPSHYLLNVYSLNKNRLSSMKETLLNTHSKVFFNSLKQKLTEDIKKHYQKAKKEGCKEVIWSNEGLYLLNSTEEYQRLFDLFSKHSEEITCICCFREVKSYRKSYMQQLIKQELTFSNEKDSYKYIAEDSWLFNYNRKKQLLQSVFKDKTKYIKYESDCMVNKFISTLGYSVLDRDNIRLNTSKYNPNSISKRTTDG